MTFLRKGGAGGNPFQIFENPTSNSGGGIILGNNSISGKTVRPTALNAAEKTLIMLVIGDSISSNAQPSAYTPTNPLKNDNLNHYDGVVYNYSDPYLGPQTGAGSYSGTIADNLITSGKFARQITIGCAGGGASSIDWAKNGAWGHRLIASLLYCRRYGYPLSGVNGNWAMTVLYMLGTNDGTLGLSAAAYATNANSCFQLLKDYGYTGKIGVPTTMTMANNAVNATIQGAQSALISAPNGIYSVGNIDSLTGSTNRIADGTHMTAAGAISLAGIVSPNIAAQY
jgi:lysophospholipase L1-like esterase